MRMQSQIEQLYESKQYEALNKLIKSYVDINSMDSLAQFDIEKILISAYRGKEYNFCLNLVNIYDKNNLKNDYLLNEIVGDCYLKINDLSEANKYLNRAIELRPSLKAARQKALVLSQRLGERLDLNELEACMNQALKSKNAHWLRINSYIAYKNLNFTLANRGLLSLISIGGSLEYLDGITFTSLGSTNSILKESKPIPSSKVSLYKSKFVKENEDNLVITLATVNNFAYTNYEFNSDRLYFIDSTNSYYIFSCQAIAEAILDLLSNKKYKKISIVGSSKAGSGALMLYGLLSKRIEIPINCVAMSPQVKLYPFNPNLKIPSYQRLSAILDIHPMAKFILSNLELPSEIKVKRGDRVTVFYGDKYTMDFNETMFIQKNSGIELIRLRFSGHATGIPLTIPNGKSKQDLIEKYQSLNNSNIDKDWLSLGGEQTINLIDEIWDIYQDQSMKLINFI